VLLLLNGFRAHPPCGAPRARSHAWLPSRIFGPMLDAERETRRFKKKENRKISLLSVRELLDVEQTTVPIRKPVVSERSLPASRSVS
jgi:hypothetical protein